jgi:hypothetical protein
MAESAAQLNAEIENYQQKHVENPDGRYFVPLANAYRKLGEFDRSERLLRDGLRLHPDYLSAHIVLGRTLADRGATAEASAEFKHVLGIDPQNLIALRSLGELAAASGEEEAAGHWYRELLAVDPMNEEARQALADLEGEDQDESGPTGFESAAPWWESPPAHPAGDEIEEEPSAFSSTGAQSNVDPDSDPDAHDAIAIDWSRPADSESETRAESDSLGLVDWSPGQDVSVPIHPESGASAVTEDEEIAGSEASRHSEQDPETAGAFDPPTAWSESPSAVEEEKVLPELEDASDDRITHEMPRPTEEIESPPVEPEYGLPEFESSSESEEAEGSVEPEHRAGESWDSDVAGLAAQLETDDDVEAEVGDAEPYALEIDRSDEIDREVGPAGLLGSGGRSVPDSSLTSFEEPAEPDREVVAESEFVSGELEVAGWEDSSEPLGEEVTSFGGDEGEGSMLEFGPPFNGVDSLEGTVGDDLVTETMAELYASQGFTDEALEVYRELVRRRGEEPGLVRRIAELEAADDGSVEGLTPEPVDSFAESFADGFSPPEPVTYSPTPEAASQVDVAAATLDGIAVLPGIDASEFSTDEGEPVSTESEPERTAAEYFAGLLAWRPAKSWGGDTDTQPAAQPDPEDGAALTAEPESGPQEARADDSWSEAVEPAPVPIDQLAPPPNEVDSEEDDDLFPWERAGDPLNASGPPGETPVEIDRSTPRETEERPSSANSRADDRSDPVVARAASPSGANEAASEEEDDDDLESFQAWLRSLKR